MARQGMETSEITNDGAQLKQVGGAALPQLIAAVERIVSGMHGTWHGSDSDAFVSAWHSKYKPQLTAISQEVTQFGQLAITNAQQQEQASSAGTAAV